MKKLSDTNCSGKPYLAKIACSAWIVTVEVVDVIRITSGHLECATTTIKNIFPKAIYFLNVQCV